jgi:hypothetical protein
MKSGIFGFIDAKFVRVRKFYGMDAAELTRTRAEDPLR